MQHPVFSTVITFLDHLCQSHRKLSNQASASSVDRMEMMVHDLQHNIWEFLLLFSPPSLPALTTVNITSVLYISIYLLSGHRAQCNIQLQLTTVKAESRINSQHTVNIHRLRCNQTSTEATIWDIMRMTTRAQESSTHTHADVHMLLSQSAVLT